MPNPVTEGLNAARAARKQLGYDVFQPIDPTAVARRLGLVVVRRPLRAAALWGAHLYDAEIDEHLVLINSSQPRLRQRFTLAHEIGHAQFDKITVVESNPQLSGAPEEKRANAFAAELLLPEGALKRWAPERPWGEDVSEIAGVALHFGVSFDATLWRLFNAGLINDVASIREQRGDVDPLLRERLREPGDGLLEYPEIFTELVKTGVAKGLVSRGRAAELLTTDDQLEF